MQISQTRRDFLASLSTAGPRAFLAPGQRSPTRGRRKRPRSGCRSTRHRLHCASVHRRGPAAGRRVHRCPLRSGHGSGDAVARGELDFGFDTAASVVSRLDSGEPIKALAGVHPGCFELFGHEPIRTVSDLKGKKVGIYEPR